MIEFLELWIMSLFERLARIVRSEMDSLHNEKQQENLQEQFEQAHAKARKNFSSNNQSGSGKNQRIAGFYANLEAPYNSDLKTVRKAWKKMVQKYHPDLHSNDPQKVRLVEF